MLNKFTIFSDFDGTITTCDILDRIITEVYSYEKYKEMENKLISGNLDYVDYLFDMFDNIQYDITNIPNYLIDCKFKNFYDWIINNNIDFYIISSGFKTIIQHLIPYVDKLLIYGNDVHIDNVNKWKVELYDNVNNNTINKNDVIKMKSLPNHKTIFIGDGLSDFKVVGNVDYLFCKKDSLLHKKCINEQYDYIIFEDFDDVLEHIKKLIVEANI